MSAIWIVFRKELLDVMRDRRTLIFMMVIPTLAIPLLMWVTSEAMTHFMQKLAREQVEVLVINPEAAPDLVTQLRERANPAGAAGRLARLLADRGLSESDLSMVKDEGPEAFMRLLEKKGLDRDQLMEQVMGVVDQQDFDPNPSNIIGQAFPPNFKIIDQLPGGSALPKDESGRQAALLAAVRTEKIAAAVLLPEDTQTRLSGEDTARVVVYYLETSDRSSMALKGLRRILRATGKSMVVDRLSKRELSAGFATPIKVRAERLPGPGILVKLMSQFLPYMILIFAFLGALYPAIDLGAGEKERGTLETLLVAPVNRLWLVIGKFGVVLVAALVSALLATISLALSLQIGFLSDLSLLSGESFSFSVVEILAALLMIVPVSCIFAALLLALSIFAKSFKEGQSYAGPLQMVIILPAMVSILPGVKLDWLTASIPVVNISLALKEIFTGNLDQHWGHVGLIFLSTSLWAGMLLWFAAWWFRREQVLFRS
jgi:sodium transport system permease protein